MMHESELRRILGADLEPSEIIDAKVEEAYRMIRNASAGKGGTKSPDKLNRIKK